MVKSEMGVGNWKMENGGMGMARIFLFPHNLSSEESDEWRCWRRVFGGEYD